MTRISSSLFLIFALYSTTLANVLRQTRSTNSTTTSSSSSSNRGLDIFQIIDALVSVEVHNETWYVSDDIYRTLRKTN